MCKVASTMHNAQNTVESVALLLDHIHNSQLFIKNLLYIQLCVRYHETCKEQIK